MAKNFQIDNLTTENKKDPIDLFTDKPRFSWQVKAYNGYKQKAYRVCVASSVEGLKAGEYDLWDSGTVRCRRSVNVRYAGKALQSRSFGYWFVEVTDEYGTTARSEAAYFEIALLHNSDWKGCFQSVTAEYLDGAQYWRSDFIVRDAAIKRARLYVCGMGYHETYVNGKKVGLDVLNPGLTDYGKRLLYCTYDITDYLVAGGNGLGFILGNGWFGGKMLNYQAYIDYEDGETEEFHSYHNATITRVSYGPVKQNSIYGGEVYDAREEKRIEGWANYGFHADYDNDWVFSANALYPEVPLVSQSFEPIQVVEKYAARLIFQEGNKYVYDLGANIAGWLKIKVKGERGARVTMRHAELLAADGKNIDTLNLRTAKQRDVYILKGEGVEEYHPRFTYHGFQYAELVVDGQAEIVEVEGQLVSSSMKGISRFECSDPVLNKLHENSVRTERDNVHSIMTDCPQRDERYGWLNDYTTRIFQQIYNYDYAKLYPKVIGDIADSQDALGRICDTAPFQIGARPADPVCIAYLLFASYSYKIYGDEQVLAKHYAGHKKWVEYLRAQTEGGLLTYSYYGDWVTPYSIFDPATPEDCKTYGDFVSSVYFVWHCKLLSDFAGILGNKADQEEYAALAQASKRAVNEKYFDEGKLTYHTGSQGSNALAVALGICEEKYAKALAEKINADVVKRNYHSTTGNQAYRPMFYVLNDYGYGDTVHKLLVNPEYPGWGYMIACGATSVWERWESAAKIEMNSFNHPMFSAFDGWLFGKVAGIEYAEDSFGGDKMVIAPTVLDGLRYATAKTASALGDIVSSWERTEGEVVYKITLPYNASATVVVSGNGVSDEAEGVFKDGKTTFIVEGGEYVIRVKE